MELHTLEKTAGSKKNKKRIGRGQGSGKGGTSTKGHKGAQSRAGYKTRSYHTGGYTPLQRSKPKFGFKNPTRKEVLGLNLHQLEALAIKHSATDITATFLIENGIVKKNQHYKILGYGELTKKLSVHAYAFSKKAEEIIQSTGGTIHHL